jgi:hypothetical protein
MRWRGEFHAIWTRRHSDYVSRTAPFDELVDRMFAPTLRVGRTEAVQDSGFRLIEVWQFQDGFGSGVSAFLRGFMFRRHGDTPPRPR